MYKKHRFGYFFVGLIVVIILNFSNITQFIETSIKDSTDIVNTIKDTKQQFTSIQGIKIKYTDEINDDIFVIPFAYEDIPELSDSHIEEINDGIPFFVTMTEEGPKINISIMPIGIITQGLDSLGRTGAVAQIVGPETIPGENEERGNISSVKPTGWVQQKYDFVDQQYLYNRCHLLAWCLTGQNANPENLITGTRSMNTNMIMYETAILKTIRNSNYHIIVRVTPIYNGNDLLAHGLLYEAFSIEDDGLSICYNIYFDNVEDGVDINYTTGENHILNE